MFSRWRAIRPVPSLSSPATAMSWYPIGHGRCVSGRSEKCPFLSVQFLAGRGHGAQRQSRQVPRRPRRQENRRGGLGHRQKLAGLRAYAKKTMGKDIAETATPVFGAAPLLTSEIQSGRLDAVFDPAGRMPRVSRVRATRAHFDVRSDERSRHFADAVAGRLHLGKRRPRPQKGRRSPLSSAPRAWRMACWHLPIRLGIASRGSSSLRGRCRFAALKEYYRSGIPGPWRADETAAAEKLMKLLIDSGDKDLVGDGTRFDPKLFRVGRIVLPFRGEHPCVSDGWAG